MSRKTLSPASVFERVLRAHETGGVTFKDVRAQLKELLAAGASPGELLDTLRRQEQWEPLPEPARVEVIRLIDEAIRAASKNDDSASELPATGDSTAPATPVEVAATEASPPAESELKVWRTAPSENIRSLEARIAGQQADYTSLTRAYERAREAELAANTRALALVARVAALEASRDADQDKAQKNTVSLAEALAANDALHARAETSVRDARDTRSEVRELSELLQARDAAVAESQTSLNARVNEVQALQMDLQAARSALAATQRSVIEGEAGRETELHVVRSSLLAEQAKSRDAAQLAEQSEETIRGLRDSLVARDAALAEAQRSLGTRAAGLEALQSDLRAARSALTDAQRSVSESGAERDTEMQAVRTALLAEQAKSRHAAQLAEQSDEAIRGLRDSLSARDVSLAEAQRSLGTRAAGLEALQSDLKAARSALAEAQRSLSERASSSEHAQSEREPPMEEQAAASQSPAESLPFLAPIPVRAEPNKTAAHIANPNRTGLWVTIGVIFLCAVAAYVLSHRASSPAPVAVSATPALPEPGTVIRDCLTCPEITVLPTGKFNQGSAGPGEGPALFEKPLHVVTIGSAFGMATNLVTVDEFQQFITASGWQSQGCTTYDGEWKARPKSNWSNPGFTQTGKHPVTCASWNDAQAYAKWLSIKAGHTYRLPSASEWEYAARAGGEAVAPWTTDSAACSNANVADNSAVRRYPGWAAFNCDDGYVYTSPVGSFKANAFGLKDMLGNVFQWTEDCWHPDYVGAPSDGTARTDGACDEHELRGGSWFTTPAYVRANYRNHFTADYRSSTVGIRLVRDLGA